MWLFNGRSHSMQTFKTMSQPERVQYWILERESIRKNKEAGTPFSWTNDPIFLTYRFCNVRREDDRVTRWLKKNWRDPHKGHPNMVGAMLLARMINWPPTLEYIGFPERGVDVTTANKIHDMAGKAWSSAYIVSTCGQRMDKALYVVQTVGKVMGNPRYTPQAGDSLDSVWTRLCGINGLGAGFIAAQVVADLKYCDPFLEKAEDWWTWAVPGPGSKRGLNRYLELPLNNPWKSKSWKTGLDVMIQEVAPLIKDSVGELHAQDWQNVLCEYDKYCRVYFGEGKPRKTYTPETAYEI